ncbi:MAG: putative DNA binding domain-containing protein [Kosmotoga sp.]|uniref:ATP-binding protein n=1 Tax=Kosmotoga sp. TaxID=1955248 RepID=UPI001E1951CB|nr:ATP-binding protein [Kosmotoga sp.]MBO8167520.1 putative DNA binding domain-containing protein [Kosmotoga sp.]
MRESENIEVKGIWKDEYLKILSAFANTDGGEMLIGIDDKGNVKGLKNASNLLEKLPHKIKNRLGILPSVKLENKDGKDIIRISVNPSDIPIPCDGKFYIRAGSTVHEIKGNDLIRFILKKKNLSWESFPSDVGIEEIDKETIELFKNLAQDRLPGIAKDTSLEKILQNLELLKDDRLTNAGLLLFGKNPQKYIANAGLRVGRFRSDIDIVDTVDIKGNLFKQLDAAIDAIKKHMNVKFEIKEVVRKDIWDCPLEAVREAVINALIHRDYLESSDIQIRIYNDRIWFWNAGKLPDNLTVEMLKVEHPSFPRNKLLATVFYFAGYIEKWGSGTKRMVQLLKEQNLPEPDFKEFAGGLSVVFYKDKYTEENLRKMGLNERQIKAVMYVKEKGRITNKEYQKINNITKRTASRDLSELVSKNIFIQTGITGKGTYYILKIQKGHNGVKGDTKGS